MKKAVLVLCSALLLISCQPIEKTARDSIAAASGFLNQAKANHPECDPQLPGSETNSICVAIWKAIDAQNFAINALEIYCAGPEFNAGGNCQPDANYKDKLKEALAKMREQMALAKEILQ